MKNKLSYLLITLVFIFSCSEAKFGFREKVKVENHSIAKTINKPHVTKSDEKKVDTDTSEIITANSSEENLILPQTLPHTTIAKKLPPSITEKKVEARIPKKSHSVNPDDKQLNIPAFAGFLLDIIEIVLITLMLKGVAYYAYIDLLFFCIPIAAFILSIIGIIQIANHREKYSGFGFALFGVIFSSIFLLFLVLLIYLITHLVMA